MIFLIQTKNSRVPALEGGEKRQRGGVQGEGTQRKIQNNMNMFINMYITEESKLCMKH